MLYCIGMMRFLIFLNFNACCFYPLPIFTESFFYFLFLSATLSFSFLESKQLSVFKNNGLIYTNAFKCTQEDYIVLSGVLSRLI